MPKLLKQTGNILLSILFIVLLVVIAYWILAVQELPWWFAVSVDSGIIALLLAILAFKSYMTRRKEHLFIDRLIEQDNAKTPLGGDSRRQQILELQNNWKESARRLQNSALRKKGNPLYVLPWYTIIGETGSGKTSALLNSGQYTSLSENAPVKELKATKNCDWYFFENAIILDTAGRYSVPVNEASDLDEWRNLLVLISQYRKKEPINGLIVTIAADTLLGENEEKIQDTAKIIRQRINHMMRSLGTKFPVYLLITKMDRVFGFDDFSRNIEQKALDEAMGFMNNADNIFWRDVFDDATETIENRLHQLTQHLTLSSEKISSLLLLPVEFNTLSQKLKLFLEPLFTDNSYQVTPPFRGIYFSSAISQKHSMSEFLNVTGLPEHGISENQMPLKGVYLKDFFSRILPADRKRYTFLEEFSLWKKITTSLFLSSWLLLILLAGGLMGYSYIGNLSVIKRFSEVFHSVPTFYGDIQSDLVMMEKFRKEIIDLENQNKTLHISPPLGFGKRGRMEIEAKKIYCMLFEKECIDAFDNDLIKATGINSFENNHASIIHQPESSLNPEKRADIADYLVLRILSLKNKPHDFREKEFMPLVSSVLQIIYPHVQQEFADLYGQLYYSYLVWNPQVQDNEKISIAKKNKCTILQKTLIEQLQNDTNSNMAWLTSLRNLNKEDIRISNFWSDFSGEKSLDSLILHGAYTQKGREQIDSFLLDMREALDDEITGNRSELDVQIEKLDSSIEHFREWYRNNFFKAWHEAIAKTDNGIALFSSLDEKRMSAISMTSADNPYFMALDISSREIITYGNNSSRPAWVAPLLHAARLRSLSREPDESATQNNKGISGAITDLKNKGKQLFDKNHSKAFADTLADAHAWTQYMNALKTLPVSSMNSKQMADAYAACFSYPENNADPAKSPFLTIYASVNGLQKIVNIKTAQIEKQEPVAVLLFGPLNYLLTYAGDATSDYLQKTWEQTVAAQSSRLNPAKKAFQLFDKKEGLVWKFVNGPASPFLCDSSIGFQPRQDMMGNVVPFSDDFLNFLDKGSILPQNFQPYYAVTFRTIPARANKEARIQPVSVRLDVASTETPFSLNNFNYPQTAVFKWNPDTCGATTLTIAFPGFTVQKVYDGTLGFARFLDDFRYGKHVFSSDEFPDKKAWLDINNINSITIAFQIDGKTPVLQLLNTMPDDLPATIIDGVEN